jgi:Fe-S cluster biogenesis protein NfuA
MKVEEKIEKAIEKVRPYIQMHGGDVTLTEVKENTAFVRFEGTCGSCPLTGITYNKVIKPLIMEAAPEITKVILET